MSQAIYADINPAATSGTQLATALNNFKAALMSGLTGTTRPSELLAGGSWIDTTQELTPNFIWKYKVYTGTTDVEIFRVNLATGTPSISGSDSLFEISKTSADTVGAILRLVKERLANNGQVNEGDVIGEIQFMGAASDNSNPVAARIRAISSDNMTGSASGAYIVFESTVAAQAVISEMMRLVDGNLGIGTSTPETTLHVMGLTGIKTERLADDALAAKLSFRKQRITGTGAVQSGDVLAEVNFNTTDDATAEATTAKIEVTALENHTALAQGTKISFKTIKVGSAALFEHMTLTDEMEVLSLLHVNAMKLAQQSIATAATISALSSDKAVVHFTGSTNTIVQGVSAAGLSKTVLLHNSSTGNITVAHENVSATATNRLKLPNSRDLVLLPDQSLEIFYDTVDTRWKLKSGSGGTSSQAAVDAIGNAVTSFAVTFPLAITGSYIISYSIENLVDTDPIMLTGLITAKSSSGFTITFNAPTDSTNYSLAWQATSAS